MNLDVRNLSIDEELEISDVEIDGTNVVYSFDQSCSGELKVDGYNELDVDYILKSIEIALDKVDLTKILADDSIRMYERKFGTSIDDIEVSELADEIDAEMDIDINKVYEYLTENTLLDGDWDYGEDEIEFRLGDYGDDEFMVRLEVDDSEVVDFINAVDDNSNYVYVAYKDGYEDEHDEEDSAIDDVENAIRNEIEYYENYDIDWDEYYVEKKEWCLYNSNGTFYKEYFTDDTVWTGTDSDLYDKYGNIETRYEVYIDGTYEDYFDDEDEAIEYAEDKIREFIDDNGKDDMDWDGCYVEKTVVDGEGENIEDPDIVWNADEDDYEEDIRYNAYFNGNFMEEFDDEDDAIERVKDEIYSEISNGGRDEIDWDECYVIKEINGSEDDVVWTADEYDFEEDEVSEEPEEPEEEPEIPETSGEIGAPSSQFPTDFGTFPTDFGDFKKF